MWQRGETGRNLRSLPPWVTIRALRGGALDSAGHVSTSLPSSVSAGLREEPPHGPRSCAPGPVAREGQDRAFVTPCCLHTPAAPFPEGATKHSSGNLTPEVTAQEAPRPPPPSHSALTRIATNTAVPSRVEGSFKVITGQNVLEACGKCLSFEGWVRYLDRASGL